MNRGNILIHVVIAVILISLAAVVGQIGRWRTMGQGSCPSNQ